MEHRFGCGRCALCDPAPPHHATGSPRLHRASFAGASSQRPWPDLPAPPLPAPPSTPSSSPAGPMGQKVPRNSFVGAGARAFPHQAAQRKASTSGGATVDRFVQGVVTYTVTDDLTATPMSSISSITLHNAFAVTDLTALQETTVQLGYNEGVEILRASLHSKTMLTDVFLGKNSFRRP